MTIQHKWSLNANIWFPVYTGGSRTLTWLTASFFFFLARKKEDAAGIAMPPPKMAKGTMLVRRPMEAQWGFNQLPSQRWAEANWGFWRLFLNRQVSEPDWLDHSLLSFDKYLFVDSTCGNWYSEVILNAFGIGWFQAKNIMKVNLNIFCNGFPEMIPIVFVIGWFEAKIWNSNFSMISGGSSVVLLQTKPISNVTAGLAWKYPGLIYKSIQLCIKMQ